MHFSRTLGAVSAGLFLAVCPQLTLGFGCEDSAECTEPETCVPVTIPTRTVGAVVPSQICAEACDADADCPSHCCGDLGVCEVPGETPNVGTGSLCTKDCACIPPEICCAARGVCAELDNCDRCALVECPDNASCDSSTGDCQCDPGLDEDDEGNCVEPDLCEHVECPDNASCDSSTGDCQCDPGLDEDDDGNCVKPDLCEHVECPDNASCDSSTGDCQCDVGLDEDDEGNCVKPVTTTCATEVRCNPKSAKPINTGAPCSGGLCNRGQCCVRE